MKFKKNVGLGRLRPKKQSKDNDGRKPLLNNNTEPYTETTDEIHLLSTQTQICNTETTDLSKVHPDQISAKVKVNGDEVLNMLRKILNEQSNPQDLKNAAVMMKTWVKQNGVTMEKKEGIYPQDWLCEFLQLIDQFVEKNFPILPTDGTQTSEKLQEFLKRAENMICSEVCRLTPALKDAGLLSYLIQSYSHQLFTKLDLLINRNLSVTDFILLLHWGKCVFFSPHSQDVFRVLDPLLFSGWFERAKHKILLVQKKEISEALHNILCFDEKHKERSEEWFIRVHIDITQYLHGAIKTAKTFSLTLMNMVQILCLEELHHFVQNYVDTESKRLKNQHSQRTDLVYLCRIINTCIELRGFAVQISNLDKNKRDDNLNTVNMLKKMEGHVLSIVQKMMKHTAQVSLRSYFKNGDEHIDNLTEEIRKQCSSLPNTEAAEEIKTIFVNLAYDCVSHVYLDCLMKNNFKRLEKRWGNVEERITQDVQNLKNTYAQLNGSDDQNQLLKRMTEVLLNSNTELLKLTCGILFNDFPEDSEQYLPGLLRWKRTLSKQQVREILDASRLEGLNPEPDNSPLMYLCCCFYC